MHDLIKSEIKRDQIDAAWAEHENRRRWVFKHGYAVDLRRRICEEQNWRCCYCGCRTNENDHTGWRLPTMEHIIPKRDGGPCSYENTVLACQRCNNERGSEIRAEHIRAIHIWEGWEN